MATDHITFEFVFGKPDAYGDVVMPRDLGSKKKIKIMPNQPINTSIFEEAIVLEENGVLTKEGLKEYRAPFTPEGELKPIIDFINRL